MRTDVGLTHEEQAMMPMCQFDTFRSGANQPVRVRVTYLPRGIVGEGTSVSYFKARREALNDLHVNMEVRVHD